MNCNCCRRIQILDRETWWTETFSESGAEESMSDSEKSVITGWSTHRNDKT